MTHSSLPAKYVQVATYLRILIEQNQVHKGGQLPTELELCKKFQCSRGPVRQAVAELAREGVVRRTRGAGTFIVERGPSASDKRQLVAAIVPNMENTEFTRATRMLGMAASRKGFTLWLGVTNDIPEIERQFIDEIARHRVMGVFKFPTNQETEAEVRRRLRDYGLPYMIVNDFWADCHDDYHVVYDERAAVEMAIEHLAGLGHRRIGMVETSFWPRSNAIRAFFKGLSQRGLPHEESQLLLYDARNELPPVEKFYQDGRSAPTGLITVYDVYAMRLIHQLRKYEMRVPEDISVVNLNGRPAELCADMDLTSAEPPYDVMMEEALGTMVAGLDKRHVRHYVYKPQLHIGGSSGPCREKGETDVAVEMAVSTVTEERR